MSNYFNHIFRKLAFKFYTAGKSEYEKFTEQLLLQRGQIEKDSRFYPGADIHNLSNNPGNIRVGHNCHISGLLVVYSYGGQIKMGDNCSLSAYSRIVSGLKIEIGNRVMIAHNVNILDNISHSLNANLRHEDFIANYTTGMREYDLKAAEIIIEDDVWIGFNATILKGVRIGRGAIIGAGSLVTHDVEPWTVNAGNPLRLIQQLSPVDVIEIK